MNCFMLLFLQKETEDHQGALLVTASIVGHNVAFLATGVV